jgi:hypothetical protein
MMEEFEKWWKHNKFSKKIFVSDVAKDAWNAAWDIQQAKLDEKDKEIEVLRGFAKFVLKNEWCLSTPQVRSAQKHGLIDKSGNPTKLLKGE